MKNLAKRTAGSLAARFGLLGRRQGQAALILMLHRVLPDADYARLKFQRSLALSQDGLDLLIRFLQQHYSLIQVDDYLALPESTVRNERFACLTFDDGWVDNFTCALPVLQAHQCPASVYLSTGFIGTGQHFWWQTWGDALSGLNPVQLAEMLRPLAAIAPIPPQMDTLDKFIESGKNLSPAQRDAITRHLATQTGAATRHGLDWQQVQAMSDSGLIRFGTHTVNHVLLPQLDDDTARQEITACADTLKRQTGIRFNNVFCYPNGDNDARIRALVQQAGYAAALGTRTGFASQAASQRFHLPRINITEAQVRDPGLFHYRLLKAATQTERP